MTPPLPESSAPPPPTPTPGLPLSPAWVAQSRSSLCPYRPHVGFAILKTPLQPFCCAHECEIRSDLTAKPENPQAAQAVRDNVSQDQSKDMARACIWRRLLAVMAFVKGDINLCSKQTLAAPGNLRCPSHFHPLQTPRLLPQPWLPLHTAPCPLGGPGLCRAIVNPVKAQRRGTLRQYASSCRTLCPSKARERATSLLSGLCSTLVLRGADRPLPGPRVPSHTFLAATCTLKFALQPSKKGLLLRHFVR